MGILHRIPPIAVLVSAVAFSSASNEWKYSENESMKAGDFRFWERFLQDQESSIIGSETSRSPSPQVPLPPVGPSPPPTTTSVPVPLPSMPAVPIPLPTSPPTTTSVPVPIPSPPIVAPIQLPSSPPPTTTSVPVPIPSTPPPTTTSVPVPLPTTPPPTTTSVPVPLPTTPPPTTTSVPVPLPMTPPPTTTSVPLPLPTTLLPTTSVPAALPATPPPTTNVPAPLPATPPPTIIVPLPLPTLPSRTSAPTLSPVLGATTVMPSACFLDATITCFDENGVPCSQLANAGTTCSIGEEIVTATFKIVSRSCEESRSSQDDSFVCEDIGTLPMETSLVSVSCTDRVGVAFFNATVSVGSAVTVRDTTSPALPKGITCLIVEESTGLDIQSITLDTSGDVELLLSDRFGMMELISCEVTDKPPLRCKSPIVYTYEVENFGSVVVNVTSLVRSRDGEDASLVDNIFLANPLSPGDAVATTEADEIDLCVGTSSQTMITAGGNHATGAFCESFATYDLEIMEQCRIDVDVECITEDGFPCGLIESLDTDCSGDLGALTFKYTSSPCPIGSSGQGSTSTCEDSNGGLVGQEISVSCSGADSVPIGSPSNVLNGDIFTVAFAGDSPSQLTCNLSALDGTLLQVVTIDLTGGSDIALTEKFGGLTLDACKVNGIERSCKIAVSWTFETINIGSSKLNLTSVEVARGDVLLNLTDQVIGTTLLPGESKDAIYDELFDRCTDLRTTVRAFGESSLRVNCSSVDRYRIPGTAKPTTAPTAAPTQSTAIAPTQPSEPSSAPNQPSAIAPNQPSEPSSAPNQPSEPSIAPNQPSEPSSAPNQPSAIAPNQPSAIAPNQPSEQSSAPNQPSAIAPNQPAEPSIAPNQPSEPSIAPSQPSVDAIGPPTEACLQVKIGCLPPFEGADCNNIPVVVAKCEDPPSEMVMRYNGGDCSRSFNIQPATLFRCVDSQGGPPVDAGIPSYITASRLDGNQEEYFSGFVYVGEEFTVIAQPHVSADMNILIYDPTGLNNTDEITTTGRLLQNITLHTSCLDFLFLNDRFGAVQLVEFVNARQGRVTSFHNVTMTYTMEITQSSGLASVALTGLEVTSNIEAKNGATRDLSQAVMGSTVVPNSTVVVEDRYQIDLSHRKTYSTSAVVLGQSDGTLCSGKDSYQFTAGSPLPPLFPTQAPSSLPTITPFPTPDPSNSPCEVEASISCALTSGRRCNLKSPAGSTCIGSDANFLQFMYSPTSLCKGNNTATNFQCDDFNRELERPSTVYISIGKGDQDVWFSDVVPAGRVIDVPVYGESMRIAISTVTEDGGPGVILQESRMSVECVVESSLTLLNYFGHLQLVGYENLELGLQQVFANVKITYMATNDGVLHMQLIGAFGSSPFTGFQEFLDTEGTPLSRDEGISFVEEFTLNLDATSGSEYQFTFLAQGRGSISNLGCDDTAAYTLTIL